VGCPLYHAHFNVLASISALILRTVGLVQLPSYPAATESLDSLLLSFASGYLRSPRRVLCRLQFVGPATRERRAVPAQVVFDRAAHWFRGDYGTLAFVSDGGAIPSALDQGIAK
jgi:hypothetical protein